MNMLCWPFRLLGRRAAEYSLARLGCSITTVAAAKPRLDRKSEAHDARRDRLETTSGAVLDLYHGPGDVEHRTVSS
jgi:hypothetical protein